MTWPGEQPPARPLYLFDFLLRPTPSLPERRGQAKPLDRGKEVRELNAYEIMLMLDPELADERQNEIVSRARELIERGGGAWHGHEPWGRRRLAYEIDKKGEAHYHLLHFQADPDTLAELTRVLKITDGAMRHMAVRRPAARRAPQPTAAE